MSWRKKVILGLRSSESHSCARVLSNGKGACGGEYEKTEIRIYLEKEIFGNAKMRCSAQSAWVSSITHSWG